MYTLEKAVRAVVQASKRFQPDAGRVARNNSRLALRVSVRRLLAVMDRDYPVVPKEQRKPRKSVTTGTWERRMRAAGWVRATSSDINIAALAGIKLKSEARTGIWAPGWMRGANGHIGQIQAAKRSPAARRALLSVAMLRGWV